MLNCLLHPAAISTARRSTHPSLPPPQWPNSSHQPPTRLPVAQAGVAAHQLVHLAKLELALQRELDQHIPPAAAATGAAGQGERASARAYRCQPCGGQPRPAGCPEPALRQG